MYNKENNTQPTENQQNFANDIHERLGYPLPNFTRKDYWDYIKKYKEEYLKEKKMVLKGKRGRKLQKQAKEKVRQNKSSATEVQEAFVREMAKSLECTLPHLTVCECAEFVDKHKKEFYAKQEEERRIGEEIYISKSA